MTPSPLRYTNDNIHGLYPENRIVDLYLYVVHTEGKIVLFPRDHCETLDIRFDNRFESWPRTAKPSSHCEKNWETILPSRTDTFSNFAQTGRSAENYLPVCRELL